jgi:hypothetical protein
VKRYAVEGATVIDASGIPVVAMVT